MPHTDEQFGHTCCSIHRRRFLCNCAASTGMMAIAGNGIFAAGPTEKKKLCRPLLEKPDERESKVIQGEIINKKGVAMTVNGKVPLTSLGFTLPHEHVIHRASIHSGKPDNTCVDRNLMVEELKIFRKAGGPHDLRCYPDRRRQGYGGIAGSERAI